MKVSAFIKQNNYVYIRLVIAFTEYWNTYLIYIFWVYTSITLLQTN